MYNREPYKSGYCEIALCTNFTGLKKRIGLCIYTQCNNQSFSARLLILEATIAIGFTWCVALKITLYICYIKSQKEHNTHDNTPCCSTWKFLFFSSTWKFCWLCSYFFLCDWLNPHLNSKVKKMFENKAKSTRDDLLTTNR